MNEIAKLIQEQMQADINQREYDAIQLSKKNQEKRV